MTHSHPGTSSDDAPPLVGVIVPVLNVERWLDEMLLSLRRQSYANWRAVIVDDGSTDRTLEIAGRHAEEDRRISVTRTIERGPGARLARIHGRSLLPDASYLYFPDGDDVLLPTLLEKLVGRLRAHSGAVAAFGRLLELHEDGSRCQVEQVWWVASRFWLRPLRPDWEPVPFPMLLSGAADAEALLVIDAAAYDRVGGLAAAPAMGSHTFRDLIFRLAFAGPIVAVDEPLYLYRRHDHQASRDAAMLGQNIAHLKEHWQALAAKDPHVKSVLAESDFLVRHRLWPYTGLVKARQLAVRGNLLSAAARVMLAAARYRPFIPG